MSIQITDQTNGLPERKRGDKPAKQKFGLVLQGGGALGAYEVGAVEYLYERGMECAIVTGASAGAMNAAALAGATRYPPRVLRELWGKLALDTPVPFLPQWMMPLPQWAKQFWSYHVPSLWVPNMYRPRLDFWNLPTWTYVAKPTLGRTLEDLLDWDQVRDAGHMRLSVSASGVENGEVTYFTNVPADQLPPGPDYQAVRFGTEHVQASGSFPGGFPWTTIRNRAYWDGGLTDNTPLKPILDNLTEDEAKTMPIFMIDVNTASAPLPASMNGATQRMLEMLVQNRLRADLDTASSYTRFIGILKQADEQLPSDAPVRKEPEWDEVMGYHHVRRIHLIDMRKPAEDSPGDFSRQSILRRISAGYDQTRAALEETSWMSSSV